MELDKDLIDKAAYHVATSLHISLDSAWRMVYQQYIVQQAIQHVEAEREEALHESIINDIGFESTGDR